MAGIGPDVGVFYQPYIFQSVELCRRLDIPEKILDHFDLFLLQRNHDIL